MVPYPTRMGNLLILLSFMLYMASMASGSGLLFLVLGVLFALYLVNLLSAWRGCKAIIFHPPASVSCTEGEALTETWEVSNTSKQPNGFVELAGPWGTLLKVGAVPAGESIHITPDLSLPRRGIYPYQILRTVCSYPFGLIQCFRSLPMAGEIVVYPSVYPCAAPLAAGFEPMVGGRYTGQNRTSSGDSFHGVRPYQVSDPVKLIHWRSSAKGLGMMSKEFDEELSGRVGIIMDVCSKPAPDSDDLLNWAARAAASLVLAALDEGHQVEFSCVGNEELIPVPPFADGSEVMEALARLQPQGQTTAEQLAISCCKIPAKASLCFVLTGVDEETRDYINGLAGEQHRRIAVYLPTACWDEATELIVPVKLFDSDSMNEEWMRP